MTPGPGDYNNDTVKLLKSRSPGYSMGFKHEKKINVTPGPGSYSTPERKAKGHYMGSSPRRENIHPEKNPGPGAYIVPSLIGSPRSYEQKI